MTLVVDQIQALSYYSHTILACLIAMFPAITVKDSTTPGNTNPKCQVVFFYKLLNIYIYPKLTI